MVVRILRNMRIEMPERFRGSVAGTGCSRPFSSKPLAGRRTVCADSRGAGYLFTRNAVTQAESFVQSSKRRGQHSQTAVTPREPLTRAGHDARASREGILLTTNG